MSLILEAVIAVCVFVGIVGILTRGRIFGSLINRAKHAADEANEKLRDPVADGKIAIADAKREVQQLIEKRRGLLVEIKNQEEELDELKAEETKWETLAQRAGASQKVDDVKLALSKKVAVTTDIEECKNELNEYMKLKDAMSRAIESRQSDIEQAEKSSTRLSKSMALDEFRQMVAKDALGEDNGTTASLKRLRIDAKNARNRAEAIEEEARTDQPAELLEQRYAVENTVTDEDVARYLVAPKT